MVDITTIAAILPAIIWSITVAFEKKLSQLTGTIKTSLLLTGFGIIPILILFASSFSSITSYVAILSVLSGILFTVGALLYYKSLETEQIANSSGTGLAQQAILLAFGILVLREALSIVQALGGIIIVAGVFLIITNRKLEINRKLLPAIFANVSWAGYWILASYAILSSNQVAGPLLISRVAALTFAVMAYMLFMRKQNFRPAKSVKLAYILLLGLLAGALDGSGNLIFGFLVKLNLLSIASIFTAAMPLFITALGYLIYKEKLTKGQAIGMCLAVAGALILAVA